jgi:uncharacterized delta-60 repeat protein
MRSGGALVLSASLAIAAAAWAAGGDLDPLFGTGGIVTTTIGSQGAEAQGVAIQSDGRIVVVGSCGVQTTDTDLALARYLPDGTVDASFGSGGIVITPLTSNMDRAYAVALDAGENIVIAGEFNQMLGVPGSFLVARYLTNGSLDMSFGTGGVVSTPMPQPGGALAIAIQSDGKIVAAGVSGEHVALARYETTGALDATFGSGGTVVDTLTPAGAFAIALQPDGKIVIGGYRRLLYSRFLLERYDVNGGLDPSFGTGGVVTTAVVNYNSYASSVTIQPNGYIVAAGGAQQPPGPGPDMFAVVRYKPDGSLDPSFDGDGKVTTSLGNDAAGHAVVKVQADGKILVAGHRSGGYGITAVAMIRYEGDGSLDASWGSGGIVTTQVGAQSYAAAAGIQVDGKIVAAGLAAGTTAAAPDFLVARYLPGARCNKAAAATDCRTADRSLLVVKSKSDTEQNRFLWKWARGESTSIEEFGDPTSTTDYALCLYGGTAGALIPQGEFKVPASAVNWSATGTGFKYDDPVASEDGMRRTSLRKSDRARAKVLFKGEGGALPEPPLPFAPSRLPLIVRLIGTNVCWESRFESADVVTDDGAVFKARH